MLEVNASVLIQIANFLILIFILNIIAYRPILRILGKRKEEMSSIGNMTEDWRERAGHVTNALDENASLTGKEGIKEKEGLKNEGMQKEKEMLQEVYITSQRMLEKAREETNEKLLKTRQSLQVEVEGFSRNLAEKVLGRGI